MLASNNQMEKMLINHYKNMVTNYFSIVLNLKNALDSKFGELTCWDTDISKLFVHVEGDIIELSFDELQRLVRVEKRVIEEFLVVHCWLSNRIDILCKKPNYKEWSPENGVVTVTYKSMLQEIFNHNDITEAMASTHDEEWNYPTIVREGNRI